MNTTWFEKGMEKGREQERRQWLRELLEARFGPLSSEVMSRLEQLPLDQLPPLQKALKAQSLAELGLVD